MKTTMKILMLFWGFLCILICNCSSGDTGSSGNSYPVMHYTGSYFISNEYVFADKGLNYPSRVLHNPVNNDVFVIDFGDDCLYRFSAEGEFKGQTGHTGQGPGDFQKPRYSDVDKNGDIYVYEWGNQRISIFSKEGTFLTSFRIRGDLDLKLSVTDGQEILVNHPTDGYYFTLYSRDGEIIKHVAAYEQYPYDNEDVNITFAIGWPFQDSSGNYYIFLLHNPVVKKFDAAGTVIREKNLQTELTELERLSDGITDYPKDYHERRSRRWFFQDIIFRNGNFYVLIHDRDDENKSLRIVYKLDSELNITGKYILKTDIETKTNMDIRWNLEMRDDDREFLFPVYNDASVLSFTAGK